jgi:hypothetical protein
LSGIFFSLGAAGEGDCAETAKVATMAGSSSDRKRDDNFNADAAGDGGLTAEESTEEYPPGAIGVPGYGRRLHLDVFSSAAALSRPADNPGR